MSDVTETENRDPFACPFCGTVHVWNATICRDCGNTISKEAALEHHAEIEAKTIRSDFSDSPEPSQIESHGELKPPVDAQKSRISESLTLKRRWNIFWIVLGIAIHVAGVHLGVFSIIKFLVEPDPELKSTIEETLSAAKEGNNEHIAILENLDEPVKTKISTIRWMLIFLLAIVPVLIGMSAGFFTGTVLDGAAAMGLSAVLIPLLNGAAEFAIIWGPANALLGAAGAYLGIRLATRLGRPFPQNI